MGKIWNGESVNGRKGASRSHRQLTLHEALSQNHALKETIKQYQDLAVVVGLIPTVIVHRGDIFNVSGVTTSDNSQTIIKGNENTNNPEKSSIVVLEPAKKTWIDILNSSATVAALIGFFAVEIGTYFYPLSYNHLISVVAAVISFMIVAMLNKR